MTLILGDCTEELKKIKDQTIDLIYLDPPFFSQKDYKSTSEEVENYSFCDKWSSLDEYLSLIEKVLIESKRILKNTGSIFLHCDKHASHYLRCLLDKTFGPKNFQSEIIWTYKRWSNSKKGLLNNHQNIYFYSKTKNFYFNTIMCNYSPSTNVDQIMQLRERINNGKTAYKLDKSGNQILSNAKNGVPLSDIWDIPYLNPKAKERTGYPTQKPVILLERILEIASKEQDLILDPFCGSGTTLLAAKRTNRRYIGIDISKTAIKLSCKRLSENIVTNSKLLSVGRDSYINKNNKELSILDSISAVPVQRNKGIDGLINNKNEMPIPVKIQKEYETIDDALESLIKATKSKNYKKLILIRTNNLIKQSLFVKQLSDNRVNIVDSPDLLIKSLLN